MFACALDRLAGRTPYGVGAGELVVIHALFRRGAEAGVLASLVAVIFAFPLAAAAPHQVASLTICSSIDLPG
jgi:hypothetical protein